MASRDHYATLGLSRGCSDDEIKKAFLQLAMKLHPDRNGGCKKSEAKFKRVNEAYNVLSDARKRSAYDGAWAERAANSASSGSKGGRPAGGGQSAAGGGAGFGGYQHHDPYSYAFRRKPSWRGAHSLASPLSGRQMAVGAAATAALTLAVVGLSNGVDALWEWNNPHLRNRPGARPS